ncbi:MAG TPA: hypothetical protein VK203_03950 [Nostocaceae cyanobacterium]|nr:hypothetical protein [Nostocaceae cyanobacterium]
MKYSLLVLAVFLGFFTYTQNAEAKPQLLGRGKTTPTQTNQAATLTTQSATIDNSWNSKIEQNNSNSPAETISLNRNPACEKKGILEYIENPESLLQECPEADKPIKNEPPEEFKPPRLESGVSVTVTQF